MENQYKSPLRAASKSTCKPCKSVGKHSKYKQQSESKSLAARVKEISDRQPYKNLLNRLLRSENLSKFVREAEKYVELAEDLVAPYQSSNPENERSRREFQEYGRALLKDGSFIRYYCKLLEKEFHEDRRRIREFFFEKYRHEVCLREKMFHDYFKEELPANEDSNSFSFTKSKSKIKEKRDHHGRSQSKSKVKARTEVSFCVRENNKNAENLSVVELVESSSSVPTNESKSDSEIPRSEAKKGKIVHFNKEPAEEPVEEATCEEENYRSPFLKYNSKESEEEREFRLSGLVKQTPTRLKSSAKRKSNVVKFADEIKSNQKLREIYEQVLKEKEEREKLLKSNDKSTDNSSKPVLRSSVAPFSTIQFSEVKLRELTSLDKEGFTEIQREILAFYPTIHLKAHRRGIRIAAEKLEGHYKGYLIRKVVFTDVHHYLEPDYIGIVAKWADGERTEGLSECPFEPDERAEVVLFE